MKYGESSFDILYLLFAVISGLIILFKKRDSVGRLMGLSALILGCGDAFHLVPRVLNYFVDADFTVWLGVGKLVTSVTMTVFYLLLYFLHRQLYHISKKKTAALSLSVAALVIIRTAVCLFPQNGWFTNETPLTWAIVRNIPFAALGIVMIVLFWKNRKDIKEFGRVWLYITLSFAFYIPVAVGAGFVPMLGMLMLPKTVCYILMIGAFLRYTFRTKKRS